MRNVAIVLLLALGIAAVTPAAQTQAVPLAGIKLIAEQSVPPSEMAAAGKNGRGNTKKAGAAIAGTAFVTWFGRHLKDANSNGELVAVDIR